MDFTAVIDYAKRFAGGKTRDNAYDDLIVDRLHNRYTVAVLVCFCIAISTYQYLGKINLRTNESHLSLFVYHKVILYNVGYLLNLLEIMKPTPIVYVIYRIPIMLQNII